MMSDIKTDPNASDDQTAAPGVPLAVEGELTDEDLRKVHGGAGGYRPGKSINSKSADKAVAAINSLL